MRDKVKKSEQICYKIDFLNFLEEDKTRTNFLEVSISFSMDPTFTLEAKEGKKFVTKNAIQYVSDGVSVCMREKEMMKEEYQ